MKTIAIAILTSMLVLSTAAQAQVYIPFQGVLERHGVLQDGDYDVKLTLFDADSGGSQVYTVTQSGVMVRGGYFSVILGPLNQTQLAHSELFLALEVKQAADANFTALQGRQRITPAVYASRAAPGYAFHAVDINAAGTTTTVDLSVTGQVNNNLKATGTVTWNCAAGTVRVGNWCISSVQPAAFYNEARIGCHDKGMGLCPVEALADCVMINPPYGGQYCDTVLDAYEWFWTDNLVSYHCDANGNFCVSNNLSAYNGSGSCCSNSPGCLRDHNTGGHQFRYFCCTPVVPRAVLP